MTFLELVTKRESTRKYSARKVSRELIDQCLEAARLAPSACNSQPWSFIVVDDEDKKNELIDNVMGGIYSPNKFARSAPVLVVVVAEPSDYKARLGGMFRDVKYNLVDIGIACEHFCLQATELGLGTCWLGWFDEKKLKKFMGFPNSTKINVVISLGYVEEGVQPRIKKRKNLGEIRKYF